MGDGRWARSVGRGCITAEGPLGLSLQQREAMEVLQAQSMLPSGWDEPAWSHHYPELTPSWKDCYHRLSPRAGVSSNRGVAKCRHLLSVTAVLW